MCSKIGREAEGGGGGIGDDEIRRKKPGDAGHEKGGLILRRAGKEQRMKSDV